MSNPLLALLATLYFLSASPNRAANWEIQTFAGTGTKGYAGDGGPARGALLNNPYGLTRGPHRALYFCDVDNHVVRCIDTNGIISTVAGRGQKGYSGDGGPAREALLNEPYEVRFDQAGNLFFVERMNHLVRRVDAKTGLISTYAGTGHSGYGGDGELARAASLNQPHSIQFDGSGNLLICDILNHRIRKVEASTGRISTWGGTGDPRTAADDSPVSTSALHGPRALTFDAAGTAWIALREGNAIYRVDAKDGRLFRAAGTGRSGFTGNGGPALAATLSGPKGIASGRDGNIYFADTESHSIRMLDPARGTIALVAGTGLKGNGPDGPALNCQLNRPHGIFVDVDGVIYVGDSENHRLRVLKRSPQPD